MGVKIMMTEVKEHFLKRALKSAWENKMSTLGSAGMIVGFGLVAQGTYQKSYDPSVKQAYADAARCEVKLEEGKGCSLEEQKALIVKAKVEDRQAKGLALIGLGMVLKY